MPAVVLSTLAGLALWIDLPVATWVRDQGFSGEWKRLIRLSETFGWGGTALVIILTAAVLDPRGWRIVPRLATSSLGAGLVADVVKLLLARLRPAAANLSGMVQETFVAWLPTVNAKSLSRAYGHQLQSFPSAHAATAAGLAVGLAALYPRGRWLFFTFAVLAGLQRIDAQAHFTSDVLAGAALGCLISAACQIRSAPTRLQITAEP
jgi:membrane-associated phospholipid phosphatase